jgi:hypothetical protein
MSSFEADSYYEPTNDVRFDLLKQPIKVDRDTEESINTVIYPQSGKTGTYYNSSSGSQTIFDFTADSNALEDLSSYRLCVRMRAIELLTADGVTERAMTTDSSVPWCFSALIDRISVRANDNATLLEDYTTTGLYKDAAMARMLKKYDSTTLESHDEAMFTPCIESGLDLTGALSTESAARSTRWLIPASTTGYVQKNIPFHDLLSCFDNPGFSSNVRKLHMEIYWRLPTEIPFYADTALTTHTPRIYIDSVYLWKDAQKMTPTQNVSTIRERLAGEVEKMAYPYYNASNQTYTQNAQIKITSQVNSQSILAAFRASVVDSTNNRNYMQFVPNGTTSVSMEYGNLVIPRQIISTNQSAMDLYTFYKKAIRKQNNVNFAPAIPFRAFAWYYLMWLGTTESIMPKLERQAKDVKININGAATASCLVVVENLWAPQISADGSVVVSK